MHKQLLKKKNPTVFSLDILELYYGNVIVSHLEESDFLEKLLVLKEIHSYEQEHTCETKKKLSKNMSDLQGGYQIWKKKRANLHAFLNSYCFCDYKVYVLTY